MGKIHHCTAGIKTGGFFYFKNALSISGLLKQNTKRTEELTTSSITDFRFFPVKANIQGIFIPLFYNNWNARITERKLVIICQKSKAF